tara:strand:- start:484 stop:1464 length:981 start_codon:yes stop_codon:yes gene_type:complete
MYNDKDFIIEEELQIGCLNPDGSGKYTDSSDFFHGYPVSDVKNHDLSDDNKKYSLYENRTATFEIEYDDSSIDQILEKVNIFQFNQSEGILMSELNSNKIGRIDLVKVKDSVGNEKKIKSDEKLKPIYDNAELVSELNIPLKEGWDYRLHSTDTIIWARPLGEESFFKPMYDSGVLRESGFYYFIGSDGNLYRSNSEKYLEVDFVEKEIKDNQEKKRKLKKEIIKLLREKAIKMPASDIDAFLKYQSVEYIKALCEKMYHNGEISRTANYRYFILTEEKKQSKKASAPKSEAVDVKAELKKYKEMLDEGLIEQEDYDAKKKELLGL